MALIAWARRCAPAVLFTLGLAAAPVDDTLAQGNYVRLVVAFPAGGPVDLMARVIGPRLAEALKENVVIENRPGGNGAVAAQYVLHEPADGKTLWLTTAGAITINPSLYAKLSYDVKSFAPVSLVVNTPEMLVVNPRNPAKNVQEFIQNAKTKQVNFASSGIGSMPHMAIALLTEKTGVSFLHVPEKGAAPAISDLMGGHVDAFVGDLPGIQAQIKSGGLKGLAIAASRRSTVFPDIPTFEEQGIKGMALNNWSGIYVSGKVPAETIDKINQAVRRTLADPTVAGKLRDFGVDPQASSPAELAALASRDSAQWARIIKANSIQAE